MNNKIRTIIITWFLLVTSLMASAQTKSVTLDTCYALAEQNYPLTKQRTLISKSREYSIQNISKGYLPQFSIHGQATYQSDVTQIPIELPGMEIPTVSKDQYKIYGEVNQTLYDGGKIKNEKKKEEANTRTEEQKLEVELYKLKDRINQLYFGILLMDEQLSQTNLLKNDIELGIKNAQALVNNGSAFKSSVDRLKAESLKVNQKAIELKALRKAFAEMLGLFINTTLNENTILVKPEFLIPSQEINRPELQLFNYQLQGLDVRQKMIGSRNMPKLNFFFQGGYGKPTFNFLSNDFDTYYIGGIRLNIPLSGLYTLKDEKALIGLGKDQIQVQREVFLFNTRLSLSQQNMEIAKLEALLATDNEIIELRTSIKNTASSQLKNGVITTNDFLEEVNAENNARQSKILHEIQLLMAQYNQKNTSGN
ncbi:MAG TPA: TolC family protein [Cytophagales bacterium]|nr:TolC family protein [Cytophagales bacterium]